MEPTELTLRPVRPTDRERVLEITADVWGGRDYLPEVFDRWVSDPSASFQAAELEGVVVGVQRLRPIGPGLAFYEGLRVAPSHRRRGVARAMLRLALEQARQAGFREVRLYTGSPEAAELFRSEGFRLLVECGVWTAGRLEGVDLPRLASAEEANRLVARIAGDPALRAYGGINPSWTAAVDVDAELLARLAQQGLVRVGPGGQAVALLREDPHRRLPVTFVAGSGAALEELLLGLRFEADSSGLEGVSLLAPADHPAAGAFAEVGYDLAQDEAHAFVFARAP